jgi:hypothetical protein
MQVKSSLPTEDDRFTRPDHGTFYRKGQHNFDTSPPEERLANAKKANAASRYVWDFNEPPNEKLIMWVVNNCMPELTSEINWPTAMEQLKALEQQWSNVFVELRKRQTHLTTSPQILPLPQVVADNCMPELASTINQQTAVEQLKALEQQWSNVFVELRERQRPLVRRFYHLQ